MCRSRRKVFATVVAALRRSKRDPSRTLPRPPRTAASLPGAAPRPCARPRVRRAGASASTGTSTAGTGTKYTAHWCWARFRISRLITRYRKLSPNCHSTRFPSHVMISTSHQLQRKAACSHLSAPKRHISPSALAMSVRPISLLILSLLRFVDSKLPGSFPWT